MYMRPDTRTDVHISPMLLYTDTYRCEAKHENTRAPHDFSLLVLLLHILRHILTRDFLLSFSEIIDKKHEKSSREEVEKTTNRGVRFAKLQNILRQSDVRILRKVPGFLEITESRACL